ncbi:dipeptidyl aminopeptidase/acylaminoacyl peptidase [Amycolatopsis methanolica 239]|uniref:Dipeptidyl aminopeptidase/acylaminoacyl peptidase n=1 Tax=Amycolatopsis methanolica 239 TaxID=1068978 RepID=A0A076N3A7_AMYME|nr:dipeptidyl aminopeptidase/acylaminoacyl peptidase [Amycolatopsis methanolica 239]
MTDDAFADLDAYVRLPRLSGLVLSPDGRRLVVGVATPDMKKNRYTTALWEVDPAGERPARRLTRSTEGESGAAFTPSGDLLFVSARPDAAAESEDGPKSALWLQPASGGDARVIAAPAGGVRAVAVAAEAGTVLAGAPMMPSATSAEHDAELRKARKDAGVSAILHEEYPIRFWDHDLGPDRTRLVVADGVPAGEERLELRDLTGHAGRALTDEAAWDVSPDGRTVVTTWTVPEAGGSQRPTVVAIDVATGERRVLADDPDHEYESPRISPDGTQVAVAVYRRSTPHEPGDYWLALVPLAGGELRPLTRSWDRWPHSARWLPDGSALVVGADDQGRAAAVEGRRRHRRGHPADRRRRRLQRPADLAGRAVGLCAALRGRPPACPGADRPRRRRDRAAARARRGPRPGRRDPRTARRGHRHRRGRHAAAGVARAPEGRRRRLAGAAAAVDPRRPARIVERLAVAVEPVARRGTGLRRAAARPGDLHRLRVRLHQARLGGVGRGAVHRPDGAHRRRGAALGGRRDPHGGDGRIVRRLHGQLGRRAHRPVQGDRHPRLAVGAGPVRADDRRDLLLAARAHPRDGGGELAAPLRRRDHHADARHPRRQGLPRPDRRGAAAVVGPGVPLGRRGRLDTAQVPLLPGREPLDPDPAPREALVRHGVRVSRAARAGQGLGAAGPARLTVTRRRSGKVLPRHRHRRGRT